jgi:hypothetical protein
MTAVETRFPVSNEKGNVKLSFPWTDAFRPSKKTSQANVHFEKASVLFNVAAVMSQQALQVERGTAEGATQACKIFQVRQPGHGYLVWAVGALGEEGGCRQLANRNVAARNVFVVSGQASRPCSMGRQSTQPSLDTLRACTAYWASCHWHRVGCRET